MRLLLPQWYVLGTRDMGNNSNSARTIRTFAGSLMNYPGQKQFQKVFIEILKLFTDGFDPTKIKALLLFLVSLMVESLQPAFVL